MARLNFFSTPKHQRYNYIPRFYDPKKEDLESRMEKFKGKDGKNDVTAVKERLSGGFRKGGGGGSFQVRAEMRAAETKRSNRLLMGVIVFLLFLTYVAFKVYVPSIVQSFE